MKRMLFLILVLLTYGGMSAQQLVAMNNPYVAAIKATMRWEATSHNFGEIKQGVPVSTTFTFTNTSDVPLLIKDVKGSCGCAVTTYTKTAIAPGEQGQVNATYNAAAPGAFHKTVRVLVNTQAEEIVLSLRGSVVSEH